MSKNIIRQEMFAKRRNHDRNEKHLRELDIIKKVRSHTKYQDAETVAIFYPMIDEVDLLPLLEDNTKTFLLPRVHRHGLEFYVYHPMIEFETSSFGVFEPKTTEKIHHEPIDLMLVPALAISKGNDRIGYGKGYYDRYLSSHTIHHTIGVIFDFQEKDAIEYSPLDHRLKEYIKVSL